MNDLYSKTMNLLCRDPRALKEIAAGAEVNLHWLSKFKQGRFSNPGVRTIERLHNFLSMMEPSSLADAVKLLGGCEATGRICDVTGKAVQRWLKTGKFPRTEATGETHYAELMAKADKRISKDRLLSSLMRKAA